MADYNIYIRNRTRKSKKKTKPKKPNESSSQTKPTTKTKEEKEKSGVSNISNPVSYLQHSFTTSLKSIPAVACACAAWKVSTKAVNTAMEFVSIRTGDYSWQTEYNNFQQTLNTITHPFNSIIEAEKWSLKTKVNNERQEQYRSLTGDAIINSYGSGV